MTIFFNIFVKPLFISVYKIFIYNCLIFVKKKILFAFFYSAALLFLKKYNIMYMKEKLVIIKMANTYLVRCSLQILSRRSPPEVPRFFIYFLWLPSTITAMVTRIVNAYAITNSIY